MENSPSAEPKDKTTEPPAPEVLQPQTDDKSAELPKTADKSEAPQKPANRLHRGSYRPSHKATFIGLAAVIAILAINAVIIGVVIKIQSKSDAKAHQGQVTVSQAALDKLGVNSTPVGDAGIELTVNPDAQFNGKVVVSGDVSIAGQLKLNNKFTANDANFTQLEAGNTSLAQLDVNGATSLTTLALRGDEAIAGTSRFQGQIVASQLVTINNSANISGNLAVGGVLSVNTLHVTSLVVDSTFSIGGHIITRGSAPSVSVGPGVGSNGTVSISGNDMAGTVAVNTGTGAVGGILAYITFRSGYSNTPHVVVTAVGSGTDGVYVNRSSSGFSIGVKGALSPGGYAFDYIVEQ